MNALLKDIRRWELTLRDPLHLQHFESSVYSQNGEDGMIEEALRRLGLTNPVFVEIGASDGRENCTRNLLNIGGSGLWLEGNRSLVERAKREIANNKLEIVCALVTLENVVQLVRDSQVYSGFDVLVVDIDGNDWWITDKILSHWHPSLVVTEYNPAWGRDGKWIMPYDPHHYWQHDDMYGASLCSYEEMMRRHGYALVACDSKAVNAFWVAQSKRSLFTRAHRATDLFVPSLPGARHRQRGAPTTDVVVPMGSLELSNYEVIRRRGSAFELHTIMVANRSPVTISSFGELPIRVGLTNGVSVEPVRMFIDQTIRPNGVGRAELVTKKGNRFESAATVQEGVSWGSFVLL